MQYKVRGADARPRQGVGRHPGHPHATRGRLAFSGYGPATMAVTGALALAVTLLQYALIDDPNAAPLTFFGGWFVAAAIFHRRDRRGGARQVAPPSQRPRRRDDLSGDRAVPARSRRRRALDSRALAHRAETLWLLPGLWQLLVSLGIFASVRSLPRIVTLVGAWYFIAAFVTLMLGSQNHALSVWTMGLPFTFGQFLMAGVLHFASGDDDGGSRRSRRSPTTASIASCTRRRGSACLTSLMAHPKGLAFADLKQLCGLTDGNLSRHLLVLQEAGLVEITKGYEGNRPHTTCRLTRSRPPPFSRLSRRARKARARRGQGRGRSDPSLTPARPGAAPDRPLFCKETLLCKVFCSDQLHLADRLHVGIIMDGNGRWATRRGLPRLRRP